MKHIITILLPLSLSNISGQGVFFEKEDWADVTDPANWDHITESAAITRGDSQPLYNPLTEDEYDYTGEYYGDPSPEGTLWAQMSTTEASPEDYEAFIEAVDFCPPCVVENDIILSLWILGEDEYWDVDMESWSSGDGNYGSGGGGFSYWRYPAGGQDEEETTYVPDDNFEQALIDLGYDDVLDNYVATDSISGITYLNVSNDSISDLTGIEYFTALTYLHCSSNQLTSLNVSNNTALTHLNCNTNSLTSLDVSNNTLLTILHAGSNQLTDLDVRQNTELTTLWVGFNSLDSLDLSANTALTLLKCPSNQLISIDVGTNIALEILDLWNNQLTTLDVNNNTALITLKASSNDIIALDVSANTALTELLCNNNQLTYLNMRNGVTDSLTTFNATNNPDLTCIETLDPDYATANWTYENGNIDEGIYFSELCSSVEPEIMSVTDVPEDQGGRVYVEFSSSTLDHPEATNQSYSLFRYDYFNSDTSGWVALTSVDAIGDPTYTFEAATLMDSTAEGNGMTEFKVVAAMNEGNFHSDPAMGYSTDDIAPGVPQGLMAVLVDEGIQLTWEMSADEDFQYYMLEKSSDEAFTEPEVFEMIDIAYLDLDYVLNESNYYRIAAVDHAGNISDYSDVLDFAVLATDLDLIPEVFALHQNYPNPFNPTTTLRYDLPVDAMVNIMIYDIMGRSIKSLVNSNQTAGYRSIRWDGKNNLGEGVSAGIYFYMLQTNSFTQSQKMIFLK